jgi:serine/threonine protein kinase
VKFKFYEIYEDLADIVYEYIPGGSIRNLVKTLGKLEYNVASAYTK